MVQTALLAEYLGNLQPFQVRHRLRQDQTFSARFRIMSRMVIGIGGSMHVDQPKLFAATRQAFRDQQAVSLTDAEGHEMVVKVDQGGIFLESPSKRRKVQLDELTILSPNPEERTRALRHLIDRLGPMAPDFSALLTKAVECELNDEEIGALFTERASGVAAFQSRAAAAFNARQVNVEALIPDSLAYFEHFCGPSPDDTDHEAYFRTILPQYRKDLIRRDLVRGLDICLQGALRDDLMPGSWVANVNDDELWAALTACDPWRDPFALLAGLDIALSRQHDIRYREFAEKAIEQLVQNEFTRPDGIDTYELLPLWAGLVLNRLNSLEGGPLRPPCWKRMCAWMQAGFLSRLTLDLSLELDSFREWFHRNQTPSGMYAQIFDLRIEPMYRAAEMSRSALREEIIGRLILVHARHKTAGRMIPGSDSIDIAVSRLAEHGSPLGCMLPGPLDGHRRPAEAGIHRLSADDSTRIEEDLANNPAAPILSHLAYLSQYFDLGEKLLTRIREAIARIALLSDSTILEERLQQLMDVGLVACAQRDEELASVIASTVVGKTHWAQSDSDVISILHALLIASAAFQDEGKWAEWLEQQLTEAAIRLPAGTPSKVFFEQLQEVKKVLPLKLGIHGRAEAFASAAN